MLCEAGASATLRPSVGTSQSTAGTGKPCAKLQAFAIDVPPKKSRFDAEMDGRLRWKAEGETLD